MNYRHIYHAGNFADVMKHMTLALILDYLQKKETGFCVIDAHGGLGYYNLQSVEAEKTKEWQAGIGRFESAYALPEDFKIYYDLITQDLRQGFYNGSPVLAAKMLRPQDRLIANELHPEDVETLHDNLRPFSNTRVTNLDAYECIRAHIPPKEKRGVILIDPPFEKKDEFENLAKQMAEWKRRFEKGVYIIWYPIKMHLNILAIKESAKAAGFARTWCYETYINPAGTPDALNGCGLLILNTPFEIPERVMALSPLLKDRMGLYDCAQEWLTAP